MKTWLIKKISNITIFGFIMIGIKFGSRIKFENPVDGFLVAGVIVAVSLIALVGALLWQKRTS